MKTYDLRENCIVKSDKEGTHQLTNFVATIKKEITYHDGRNKQTHLVIGGTMHDETPLPDITVQASQFAGMGWVAEQWGMKPIIFPAASAERDIKTAIQLHSNPERESIYQHTGWAKVDGERAYLTTTGAIMQGGLRDDIKVQLPHELSRYALPQPQNRKDAFLASLRLVNVGDKAALWPLLLATYRAPIRETEFAVHLAGRTGTYKSEVSSLMQSHYGEGMDARHLPCSWSSTANAIEALAYRAKDALMVLDDFVPTGTAYQVRALQKTADQIMRAQGNQAGRSRLNDTTSLQTTYYPRGLILSTGEDIPEGQSLRGRMLIVEIAPGSIVLDRLSDAQGNRHLLPHAMADWILWLATTNAAEVHHRKSKEMRDENVGIGHTRTPTIIGDLCAVADMLRQYAVEKGFATQEQMDDITAKAWMSILDAGRLQSQYLTTADPVTAMMETIRSIVQSGVCHLKTPQGGIPTDPEAYGWKKQEVPGNLPTYASQGPRLGWIDLDEGEVLIDPSQLVFVKKYSGGRLQLTQQTLLKRLKEASVLTRTDDARQRNTVRATLEGHPRQVLAINAADVFND